MFQKSMMVLILSVIAASAAQAGEASHKAKVAEAQAKISDVFSDIFGDNDMKRKDGKDSLFGQLFGADASQNAKRDNVTDDDNNSDGWDWSLGSDSSASSDDCATATDGKPGANYNGSGSTNGGNGGTIIIDGKAAKDGCYSANGGDGGSGNWSFGNNKVGQPGKAGKIIAR